MEDWASIHGKCVRQVCVQQQITKFKGDTCPLEIYQRKLPGQGGLCICIMHDDKLLKDNSSVSVPVGISSAVPSLAVLISVIPQSCLPQ